MANEYTRIADVIVPEIVDPAVGFRINEKSALISSGAVFRDPSADAFASNNFGKVFETAKYLHIEDSESNVGSDDPTVSAESKKNKQISIRAVKHFRNKIWGEMDLTSAVSQPNPNTVVAEQVGDYWAQEYDNIGISSLVGLWNDNVANNGGDMVHDISIDTADPLTSANLISSEAIIDAQSTMGDNQHDLSIMIVHSKVYAQLRKNNEIDFVKPSEQGRPIPMWGDAVLFQSDRAPAIMGTEKMQYVTILIGANSIRWGEGTPKTPSEIDRDAKSGNGEGGESYITRRHFVLTPANYSFAGGTVAGQSPTRSELEDADNWSRGDVERKDIKIAFLITNG